MPDIDCVKEEKDVQLSFSFFLKKKNKNNSRNCVFVIGRIYKHTSVNYIVTMSVTVYVLGCEAGNKFCGNP